MEGGWREGDGVRLTFTSREAPKPILKSPFWSLTNSFWKVCLKRELLKKSPMIM